MTPTHQQNTDVVVTVDFPQIDGTAITPTTIGFVVLDERGVVVRPQATASSAASAASATVPAASNQLAAGAVRGLRNVRFEFQVSGQTFFAEARYVIEAVSKLVTMTNSFQTYEEALLTRFDLPTLDGWDVASEAEQIAALTVAHDRMCRLTYRYRLGQDAVEYDESIKYWYVSDIRQRTLAEFNAYPEPLKQALRRAQLYEADAVLSGDPVGDKRLAGVISETIGESKMFFSNVQPARTPLCRAAMDVIGPHFSRSNRIGRV